MEPAPEQRAGEVDGWRVVVVPSGTRCPTSQLWTGATRIVPLAAPVRCFFCFAHVFEQRLTRQRMC